MTLREALERDARRTTFSSGSAALDRLLGGGFRTGEMVEVFGASGTGKTQLAIQAALSAAAAGSTIVYVDTEGQFRPERLASIAEARGVDPAGVLSMVYRVRATSTEEQVAAIARAARDGSLEACRMVVVDTVTKNFSLEFGGSGLMANRQSALGAYLNRLARDAYINDRAVLLLNRVATIGQGDGEGGAGSREVGIGGETLRRYVQRSLRLRRKGDAGTVRASVEEGDLDAALGEGEGRRDEVALAITARGLEEGPR
jgi:RecA/RadA recombinase